MEPYSHHQDDNAIKIKVFAFICCFAYRTTIVMFSYRVTNEILNSFQPGIPFCPKKYFVIWRWAKNSELGRKCWAQRLYQQFVFCTMRTTHACRKFLLMHFNTLLLTVRKLGFGKTESGGKLVRENFHNFFFHFEKNPQAQITFFCLQFDSTLWRYRLTQRLVQNCYFVSGKRKTVAKLFFFEEWT